MLQLVTTLLAMSSTLLGIKEPSFKVVDKKQYLGKNYNKKHDYEIRNYSPYVTATVNDLDATSNGFRKLAGYIGVMGKPQNKQNKKMPMTKPVLSTQIKENAKFNMSFVMLVNSTESVPEPNDSTVHIDLVEEQTIAVRRFRWRYNPKLGQEQMAELLKELIEDKVFAEGTTLDTLNWRVAQYNSPWIPGLFRRNEVWIQVPKTNKIEMTE